MTGETVQIEVCPPEQAPKARIDDIEAEPGGFCDREDHSRFRGTNVEGNVGKNRDVMAAEPARIAACNRNCAQS